MKSHKSTSNLQPRPPFLLLTCYVSFRQSLSMSQVKGVLRAGNRKLQKKAREESDAREATLDALRLMPVIPTNLKNRHA